MIKDRNVRPLCQLSSHFLKPPKVIEIQDGSTDGTKKKEPKESKTEEENLMNTKDDNATRKQSQSLIAFCTSHHIQFLIPEKPCANTVLTDPPCVCAHNTTHHLSLTKVRYSATTVKYARDFAFAKDQF